MKQKEEKEQEKLREKQRLEMGKQIAAARKAEEEQLLRRNIQVGCLWACPVAWPLATDPKDAAFALLRFAWPEFSSLSSLQVRQAEKAEADRAMAKIKAQLGGSMHQCGAADLRSQFCGGNGEQRFRGGQGTGNSKGA